LKPIKVISRRGVGEEGDYGGMNQSRVQYMYISQRNPLDTDHILTKTFFKRPELKLMKWKIKEQYKGSKKLRVGSLER
jgi:hypothetical protein